MKQKELALKTSSYKEKLLGVTLWLYVIEKDLIEKSGKNYYDAIKRATLVIKVIRAYYKTDVESEFLHIANIIVDASRNLRKNRNSELNFIFDNPNGNLVAALLNFSKNSPVFKCALCLWYLLLINL
eukprot:snap_masked-scaffold_9-processed-gene-6.20-mRNA-1 protein AED:1.00 eAED:1.00 QI:0/0/0/0/1/1/3/0/126